MVRCGITMGLAVLVLGPGSAVAQPIQVVVWDEQQPRQKQAYADFLGNAIANHLARQPGLVVRSMKQDDAEQGLSAEILDFAQVLIWWGHARQQEISAETARRIVDRVQDGRLALMPLHSAHWSTPFMEAMNERTRSDARKRYPDPPRGPKVKFQFVEPPGRFPPTYDSLVTPAYYALQRRKTAFQVRVDLPNCCFPGYRADGKPSTITVLESKHPVARGLPKTFRIPHTEMYDEPFHVPEPDVVVFKETWETGEWFRSGCVWQVGKGKVFYFRPGHETYPIYKNETLLKIVDNAVRWLAGGDPVTASRGGGAWRKHVVQPASQTGSMVNSAVASDFDGDGHVDILSSFDGKVVLFAGPDRKPCVIHRFDPAHSRSKPRTNCIHSCLLDVDRDGDMDFCGSNNTVFWLECPSDPLGEWTYRTIDDEILGTHCLLAGDVDQDGQLDLIANSGRSQGTQFPHSLTWQKVPAEPRKASHWIRHVFADRDAPGGSHYTGCGDVDGDGRPDISCAAKGGEGFAGGQWFAWWQQPADPTGVWKKHVLAENQPGATNIHPVDLNGDGHMDFFATRGHGQGVLWFRGPNFEPLEIDPDIEGPHCLVTIDLDGDGDIDAATCGRDVDGVAAWYENDGNGQFTKHVIGVDQGSYDIRAVDLDNDSDLDLLIAGHTSNNIVWYENPLSANVGTDK